MCGETLDNLRWLYIATRAEYTDPRYLRPVSARPGSVLTVPALFEIPGALFHTNIAIISPAAWSHF